MLFRPLGGTGYMDLKTNRVPRPGGVTCYLGQEGEQVT